MAVKILIIEDEAAIRDMVAIGPGAGRVSGPSGRVRGGRVQHAQ